MSLLIYKEHLTLNHSILIDKLNHYGIRGIGNKWFKSYLTNRSQFVSLQGYESVIESVKHGVPQGSVLGPQIHKEQFSLSFCR